MSTALRSIAEDFLAGRQPIAARFAFAHDDWAGAVAMRRKRPAPPWADEDLEELRRFNAEAGAPGETLAQIHRLADPATRVVVAGQQAGLALGPLYTLYKALGAVARARRIEDRFGVPTVPCFWIAAEDHDFDEARTVFWLSQTGEIESFRYEPETPTDGLSVGDIPVEPQLRSLCRRLEETTAPTEFRPWVASWLDKALEQSPNLEALFARLLLGLLGRFGLVALTPRLMGFRRGAAALFHFELARPQWTSRQIIAAGQTLRSMGYEPVIHRRPTDLNFFFYEGRKRCKLVWEGDKIALRLGAQTLRLAQPDELRQAAEGHPDLLSCNVVSRPICQDLSLPTLGCLAGPAELAYFAQLREIYEGWSVPMPLIARRPSALLIDAPSARLLNTDGLSMAEVLEAEPQALARRLAARAAAAGGLEALGEARRALGESLRRLRERSGQTSASVDKAIDRLAEAQEKGLRLIEQRLERDLSERSQALLRRLTRAARWLHPHGKPQERVYSVLAPLLVNYGLPAIDRLAEQLDPERTDLQIINLQETSGAGRMP